MVASSRLGEWLRAGGPFRPVTSRIRNKLILGFLLVSIFPLALLGLSLYSQSAEMLLAQGSDELQSVRDLRAEQLAARVGSFRNELLTLRELPAVREAASAFGEAFETAAEESRLTAEELETVRSEVRAYYGSAFQSAYRRAARTAAPPVPTLTDDLSTRGAYLQHLYVVRNPNRWGEKSRMLSATDGTTYADVHALHHPLLSSIAARAGFDDLLLVDPTSGEIVYSVAKQIDFGHGLYAGPLAKSRLAAAVRSALDAEATDAPVLLSDVDSYLPAFEQPTSFFVTRLDVDGAAEAVLVARVAAESLTAPLAGETGLGRTGELLAVSADGRLLNEPRISQALNIGDRVESPAVDSSLSGESRVVVLPDADESRSVTAFGPVSLPIASASGEPITWGLLARARLDELQAPMTRVLTRTLVIAGLVLLAVIGLAVALARGMTRQTDEIVAMLDEVGVGNFDARAAVVSGDELGTVAASLNGLCDNTLSLIQSREEREELEDAVEKLRREVAVIASGDLTIEAEVGTDVTGDIADSVNYMIGQLREIIANVQDATVEVSGSANAIRATTEQLSDASDAQAKQIRETSLAVTQVASSMEQVSRSTQESAGVAKRAHENARRGTRAVQDTIAGMNRIREQVRDSSKRIKRLGETSQQVGEIVQLISDISDRTSILALNASIQAAMAGDAGHGFAVVAEEVERLAERCNDATRQIATLIKAIQSDTAEAVVAMEQSTREVVEGSTLASEAGEALHEIDVVSEQLAELIGVVSDATTQQAVGANTVARSMDDVASATETAAAGARETAASVTRLAELADALHNSVSAFRLPDPEDSVYVFDLNPDPEGVGTRYSGVLLKGREGESEKLRLN